MLKKLYFRLSVLQFLQFFIWGSWFVTAGTYLLQTLSFSGREVGMVYGTTAIAATITPFLVGILADRFFSIEKLLFVLHFVGGGLLFALSFVTDFNIFYPLILAYVMCYLPTFSLSNALCFHHVEDTKKDFPKVRVWGTISWIIAGLFIGWLEVEDKALPFQIAAACSILQGFYCLTLPPTPPQPRTGVSLWQNLNEPEVKTLLRDSSLIIMIISIGFICIPHSYYYSFVNPFLNEVGVTNAAGKMSLGQVSEIIFMLSLPWFFKIWRLKTIISIGLFVWGARYGLFIIGIHFQSEWWYLLALSLHGLAYIFSMLSAQIYLDSRVPVHLRSTGQGFYSLLTLGLGVFIGSYLAGEQVSQYTLSDGSHDWASIWAFPTYFGIGVSVFFWLFFRGRQKA